MVDDGTVRVYICSRINEESECDSFYRKVVSTMELRLNGIGIISLYGDHWFSGTEKERGCNCMVYHHHSGASVVVSDGDTNLRGGNINVYGSEEAIVLTKKSLDFLVDQDFKIEELN